MASLQLLDVHTLRRELATALADRRHLLGKLRRDAVAADARVAATFEQARLRCAQAASRVHRVRQEQDKVVKQARAAADAAIAEASKVGLPYTRRPPPQLVVHSRRCTDHCVRGTSVCTNPSTPSATQGTRRDSSGGGARA